MTLEEFRKWTGRHGWQKDSHTWRRDVYKKGREEINISSSKRLILSNRGVMRLECPIRCVYSSVSASGELRCRITG